MREKEEQFVLLKRAHAGEKEARDQLAQQNTGLVWSIVQKYQNRGKDVEDLFQVGMIGLLKAIDRFDVSYDVAFSTYAVPLIAGEIRRFLRDDGMIRVSRSLKESAWKIQQVAREIEQKEGRQAHLSELQEKTKLSVEEIVQALDANAQVESLYKPVYQSEGKELCLQDQIPAKEEKEAVLNRILLEKSMSVLDEQSRRLIVLRYFEDKTQMETAKLLGMTQVQVSRKEKKILLQMREVLRE
ncbi:MAG: SigB/SigF/SigG family RNA polymerase sigma factor [Lachnospiraceae bacterium]